jgi:hypothetical protein
MRPDEFKPGSTTSFSKFRFLDVDPPSPLYIQRDDHLFLTMRSSIAGAAVQITGGILLAPFPRGGQPDQAVAQQDVAAPASSQIIEPISATLTNVAAYSATTATLALTEGYLLRLGVQGSNTTQRGRTFVTAEIFRNPASGGFVAQLLFADYVANGQFVTWPNGRVLTPIEGPGWKHSLQVANPGAGVDWALTMNANQRERIESLNAVYTASAVVANRQVQFIVDDGANVMGVFNASANIVASATVNVTGTTGSFQAGVITTDVQITLPSPLILEPGWRLRALTVGKDAGDTWTAIWLNVEEWLEII